MFDRYAIYWAPEPESELAHFARGWFHGEIENNAFGALRDASGLGAQLIEQATRSPRRYGLHATIKAPFRLKCGINEAGLSSAAAEFCSKRRRLRTGPLKLHRFTRYLALVPASGRAELEWLADECVTYFDRFRAPLNDADRTRRSGSLSSLEENYFEQFGYPHIFSLFFFHITLAGPLPEDDLEDVEKALAPAVEQLTADRFILQDLCVFGDPGNGSPFDVISRHPLM